MPEPSTSQSNSQQNPQPDTPELSPDIALKIKRIPTELAIFVEPGNDLSKKRCSKEKIADVMKYFGVNREFIPKRGLKKEKFVAAYKKHLEPQLQPFVGSAAIATAATDTAATDTAAEKKRKAPFISPSAASCGELRSAIITRIKASMVPAAFTKAALVRLWKHVFVGHVSDDPSEFIDRPHLFTMDEISSKSRDVLRHALQCECPEIFIPLAACTEPILRALYDRFVLENEELDNELCYGVHYYQIPFPDDDTDAQMGNNGAAST